MPWKWKSALRVMNDYDSYTRIIWPQPGEAAAASKDWPRAISICWRTACCMSNSRTRNARDILAKRNLPLVCVTRSTLTHEVGGGYGDTQSPTVRATTPVDMFKARSLSMGLLYAVTTLTASPEPILNPQTLASESRPASCTLPMPSIRQSHQGVNGKFGLAQAGDQRLHMQLPSAQGQGLARMVWNLTCILHSSANSRHKRICSDSL